MQIYEELQKILKLRSVSGKLETETQATLKALELIFNGKNIENKEAIIADTNKILKDQKETLTSIEDLLNKK